MSSFVRDTRTVANRSFSPAFAVLDLLSVLSESSHIDCPCVNLRRSSCAPSVSWVVCQPAISSKSMRNTGAATDWNDCRRLSTWFGGPPIFFFCRQRAAQRHGKRRQGTGSSGRRFFDTSDRLSSHRRHLPAPACCNRDAVQVMTQIWPPDGWEICTCCLTSCHR